MDRIGDSDAEGSAAVEVQGLLKEGSLERMKEEEQEEKEVLRCKKAAEITKRYEFRMRYGPHSRGTSSTCACSERAILRSTSQMCSRRARRSRFRVRWYRRS